MPNTERANDPRSKKKRKEDEPATLIIPQITPEIIARAREAMAQGMSAEEAAKLATAEAAEAAAAKAAPKPRPAAQPRETTGDTAVSVQPRKREGMHPGVAVRTRPQAAPRPRDVAGVASAPLAAPVAESTHPAEQTSSFDTTSPFDETSSFDTTSTLEATASLEATSPLDTTATVDTTATSAASATAAGPAARPAAKPKNRVKKTTRQSSAKAGPRSRRQAERELFQNIHDDHLWLNNPMMVRGLGLAPAVVAAADGDNALMLCVAALCLITLTRVLSVAICHLTDNRHRPLIYAFSAALVYIPTYILLFELFGSDLTALGIYLPLLAVEPVVLKRVENDALESVGEALRRGLNNSFGYCIALLLVGIVREFLASGSFFGNKVVSFSLLPLAAQPAGGFILIGVICAVWTAVGGAYVHYKREEVRHLYADADKH